MFFNGKFFTISEIKRIVIEFEILGKVFYYDKFDRRTNTINGFRNFKKYDMTSTYTNRHILMYIF